MPDEFLEKVGETRPRPEVDAITFCIADDTEGQVEFSVGGIRRNEDNPEELLGEAMVSFDGLSLGEQLTVRLPDGKIRETAKYVVEHRGAVVAAGAVVLGSLYVRHRRHKNQ